MEIRQNIVIHIATKLFGYFIVSKVMENAMPTYVYECNKCNRIRTVTQLNEQEACCNSLMRRTKTYQRSLYEKVEQKISIKSKEEHSNW